MTTAVMGRVDSFIHRIQEEDDEPLTKDELLALERAQEDIAAGHFYTLEEYNRIMSELP